jgi:hypothetical protein
MRHFNAVFPSVFATNTWLGGIWSRFSTIGYELPLPRYLKLIRRLPNKL